MEDERNATEPGDQCPFNVGFSPVDGIVIEVGIPGTNEAIAFHPSQEEAKRICFALLTAMAMDRASEKARLN